jgi:hypothetical protein
MGVHDRRCVFHVQLTRFVNLVFCYADVFYLLRLKLIREGLAWSEKLSIAGNDRPFIDQVPLE